MACNGPVDRIVGEVLAAVQRQDHPRLKELLHPYLHWSEPRIEIRGRAKVFARLAASPPPGPPVSYELRDGQIYRWNGG
jgi:hypothetical protein